MKDIQESEIRIIGTPAPKKQRRWSVWLMIVCAVALLAGGVWFWTATTSCVAPSTTTLPQQHSDQAVPSSFVTTAEEVVNDVPLRILTPQNANPMMGCTPLEPNDTSIVLALQATDIRADNNGIVCESVVDGVLLSKGVAKRGFCALVGGVLHLGSGVQTPLLEQAIHQKGSFFRQYVLVNAGKMVENTPKGKALRRALATKNGQFVVVESLNRESLHDFAQALADWGAEQALALRGGATQGFYRKPTNETSLLGQPEPSNTTHQAIFLVWRSK